MKSKFSGQQIDFNQNLRLKLKEQVGSGSFSYIYTTNQPQYVIKLINKSDEKSLKSFHNEKHAYEIIGKHDNIIECVGSKETVNLKGINHACLALENCPKGSVINMIVNKKIVFSEAQILQIFLDVLTALNYLHTLKQPIAHRDLKLENVLLAENGKFKLCDFGSISTNHIKEVNSSNRYELTEDIEANTTPPYRAPEQCDLYSGLPINEKADIWAAGCMLFVLAYQKLPFESKLSQINCQYFIPKTPIYTNTLTDIFPLIFCADPNKRCSADYLITYLEMQRNLSPSNKPTRSISLANNSKENNTNNKNDKFNTNRQRKPSAQPTHNNNNNNNANAPNHYFDFEGFGNTNEVKPSFLSICNKYFAKITTKTEAWVLSALEENEDAPNQKYVRYLIIKAWNKREKIKKFYSTIMKKLNKTADNTIISLKILVLIHNYLKKGPPEAFDIVSGKDTPIDVISCINKTWKRIYEGNSPNRNDKKRNIYSNKLIYDYSNILIQKIKLHIKYVKSFEGNFSLNPFFTNPNQATNPINITVLQELLNYMKSLIGFHQTLLLNNALWKIQLNMALSVIDEEYCLISTLAHLLATYKNASNYISIDIDKKSLEKSINSIEETFSKGYLDISTFFSKCINMPDLIELRDIIPSLSPHVLDYIKSIEILKNFPANDFNLGIYLNYSNQIHDIKIPLSYGVAVKDLNILDIISMEEKMAKKKKSFAELDNKSLNKNMFANFSSTNGISSIQNNKNNNTINNNKNNNNTHNNNINNTNADQKNIQTTTIIKNERANFNTKPDDFKPDFDTYNKVNAYHQQKVNHFTLQDLNQTNIFEGFNFNSMNKGKNTDQANKEERKLMEIVQNDANSDNNKLFQDFSHQAINWFAFGSPTTIQQNLNNFTDANFIFFAENQNTLKSGQNIPTQTIQLQQGPNFTTNNFDPMINNKFQDIWQTNAAQPNLTINTNFMNSLQHQQQAIYPTQNRQLPGYHLQDHDTNNNNNPFQPIAIDYNLNSIANEFNKPANNINNIGNTINNTFNIQHNFYNLDPKFIGNMNNIIQYDNTMKLLSPNATSGNNNNNPIDQNQNTLIKSPNKRDVKPSMQYVNDNLQNKIQTNDQWYNFVDNKPNPQVFFDYKIEPKSNVDLSYTLDTLLIDGNESVINQSKDQLNNYGDGLNQINIFGGDITPPNVYGCAIPQPNNYPGGGIVQPNNYPGVNAQLTNYPNDFVQLNNYPGGIAQPNNYPDSIPQPNNHSGGVAQPNNYPGGILQPNNYPGGVIQPNNYLGAIAQPNNYGDYINQLNNFGGGGNQPNNYKGSDIQAKDQFPNKNNGINEMNGLNLNDNTKINNNNEMKEINLLNMTDNVKINAGEVNLLQDVDKQKFNMTLKDKNDITSLHLQEFIYQEISKNVKDYIINYSSLKFERMIGSGGSCEVFKGSWRGADVAIKKIKMNTMKANHIIEFERELAALVKIRPHQNLVSLMGVSKNDQELCIITEYCHGGTVFDWLHMRKDFQITMSQKVKIARDVACGMNYLHTCDPPMIHRDMKSLNLLLDAPLEKYSDRFTTKIADFGLAKAQNINPNEKMTGLMGTYHWMAPEIFENKNYTIKADVYSYGIVLWEICSRETPYQNLNSPAAIMKYVTIEKGRPDLAKVPKYTPSQLVDLMVRCWDHDPDKRPFFEEILNSLNSLMKGNQAQGMPLLIQVYVKKKKKNGHLQFQIQVREKSRKYTLYSNLALDYST